MFPLREVREMIIFKPHRTFIESMGRDRDGQPLCRYIGIGTSTILATSQLEISM